MPNPNTSKVLNGENSKFTFAVQPTFTPATDPGSKKRLFSGVAYSGEVIRGHYYWGDVVFDMATITLPSRLPALIDHDRGQRCGYVTDSAITDATGFTVQGVLLSNEHGRAVAQDSDEGFPWQMSVHINPGSIEEVASGTTITVNGRTLVGPVVVFRNSTLSEVSFTAAGWDSNTSAAAMSRGGDTTPSKGDDTMDLQQALARVAALEAEATSLKASNEKLTTDLENAQASLKQFSAATRATEIQRLFSDTGREYKADSDEVKAFMGLPEDAFTFTANLLREQSAKAAPPAGLFSHQAGLGTTSPTATPPVANPLLADAKLRASQFAK